jgi:hypothetical protein
MSAAGVEGEKMRTLGPRSGGVWAEARGRAVRRVQRRVA